MGREDRAQFRRVPLDGAALYFHPASGTHVRVENASTRSLRRSAPRVVMFGITNACNFDCAYCSRDRARPSRWTHESALGVLQGLCAAGTLEVAFGGGEPFAFRGFAGLIDELHATTSLALHVTTNGSLLNSSMWAGFSGRFGQVRLSLHHDLAILRRAARTLSEAGQLFGANLIVDAECLARLPELLVELAELGCHDVSLLRYVGADASRHLDALGRERLAACIAEAPLPCRVSVCFGSELSVPRLFDGADGSGDCGAGYDFVTLSPDRKLSGCSFQDSGLTVERAVDVLRGWRLGRARFAQPASRDGCARRALETIAPARQAPPLAIW
ncbi:MAG: radical SAM protein [Polyangiaceae bacterium]